MARPLRTLFVSRERIRLPLEGAQKRKWDAIRSVVDARVIAVGSVRDDTFRLLPPDSVRFQLQLPFRIARELRSFRPQAAIVQGVHEGAAFLLGRALARMDTKLVLDIHGDWRQSTRLYGSPARRLLTPISDALPRLVVPRADAVRTVSADTTRLVRSLGVEPAAAFPAFLDTTPFRERLPVPLHDEPEAVFVGSLEKIKGFDTLVAAWPIVQQQLPQARLRVVGAGHLAYLASRLEGVESDGQLSAADVASALDRAWVLVLPSRSEGFGRVIVEAAWRGRGAVATRTGGIADLVDDGETGLLVETDDPVALAQALVAVLSDRERAQRMGNAAHAAGERWVVTPELFADRIAQLVRDTAGG